MLVSKAKFLQYQAMFYKKLLATPYKLSLIHIFKATQVVQQSAPFDLGALVEALKGEFATREDLQDIVSKAVQPVNNNLEQRRQQELAEYRERLIKDNEGKCIPEPVSYTHLSIKART